MYSQVKPPYPQTQQGLSRELTDTAPEMHSALRVTGKSKFQKEQAIQLLREGRALSWGLGAESLGWVGTIGPQSFLDPGGADSSQ